ncbi:hypothetical protein OF001_U280013 [Pseudomonas sp. OF001]|nr:hypothetical protein OF001_U280013 [Pseudomonas sp. OF001]
MTDAGRHAGQRRGEHRQRLAIRRSPASGPYFIVYRETGDTAPGVPGRQAGLSGQGSPP